MAKENDDIICDKCPARPVANYQKVWVRWSMTKGGSYSKHPNYNDARDLNDMDEPTGDDNVHVCAAHEEELLNGEFF